MKWDTTKQTSLAQQLLFALGIMVFFLVAVVDTYACQCRERQPPCAQYWSADAVFIGSVVRINSSDEQVTQIHFSVERAIAGVSDSTIELVNYGTSCDYGFVQGKTYLVYAYRNSKRTELYTHYCTRTTELSNASADLAFFKLLPENVRSQQILGVLAEDDKRLRGVRVVASSAGRYYRTVSDKNGWFRLNVPRPGNYRVRMLLPLYSDVVGTKAELDQISKRVVTRTRIVLEYEVSVESGKCAFINPPLFVDRLEYEKQGNSKPSRLK